MTFAYQGLAVIDGDAGGNVCTGVISIIMDPLPID